MITKINNLWTKLRTSLWFIPTIMTAVAIALVRLTLYLDKSYDIGQQVTTWQLLAVDSQGARALLATMAGSIIGIAGVSFSITIVSLTLATSQFGPRLLNNFMKDVSNQLVLGAFIATFIYCLLVLGAIQESETQIFVPQLSIKVGIILALFSLGMFIYFIHHISASIHADNVIADVAKDLEKSINRLFPEKIGEKANQVESLNSPFPQNFAKESQKLATPSSGYLQAIDHSGIMSLATEYDVFIQVKHHPGDFIMAGETLARVWPPKHVENALLNKLTHAFIIGSRRTEEQDVKFSIYQLVELALRAISPGINDPFTAIECIDRLGECLSELFGRVFPSAYYYDDKQKLRVLYRPDSIEDIFSASFNHIRQYATSHIAVGLRLLETFATLATLTDNPKVKKPLLKHAKMVKADMIRCIDEINDKEEVEKRYDEVQKQIGEI